MIRLKRVYEGESPDDGKRFLVERLWPRGIGKSALRMDGWYRDVAPSTDLRKWFAHDPEKWTEFRRRYHAELDARPEVWKPLAEAAASGTVTLLFSSRDLDHNNAVALKDYLEGRQRPERKR